MTELLDKKQQRKAFSSLGWALLIYLLLMNACVVIFAVIDMFFIQLRQQFGEAISSEEVTAMLMSNGCGYLVTISLGLIALLFWKGADFCQNTLWTRGKPMDASSFLALLCIFLCGQLAFVAIASIQEAILNIFGLSAMDSIESATMGYETLSMYVYAAIGAPIMEEIIFRGLVLRHLEPWGKNFAIVMSAFLFGIFHGNVVQIPYAFLVGLVLGYVTIEHNILWAMVLHMINNMVLGDLINRILPVDIASLLLGLLIIMSALAGWLVLAIKKKDIRDYWRSEPIRDSDAASFFTSPGIIALELFILYCVASPLVNQIIAKMG